MDTAWADALERMCEVTPDRVDAASIHTADGTTLATWQKALLNVMGTFARTDFQYPVQRITQPRGSSERQWRPATGIPLAQVFWSIAWTVSSA
jgi:hypothetical protein